MRTNIRMLHYLWKLVNSVQQSTLIPIKIRTLLLRVSGMQIDPTTKLASNIFIGSHNVRLGAHTFVNIYGFLDGNAPIIIGDHVEIGPYVKLLTGTHTINPGVLRRSGKSEGLNLPIEIKRGAWIGMGTIILPGITIEEGCVIGAGSVVVHSTEPNGLYVGCPAKRIKDLPTESTP